MPLDGEVLGRLRSSVGNNATVLGFVGAPWTLAAYVVEGKSSKNFAVIKAMAFREPELLHKLLNHFAESIATYLRYQIDSGAQVVQMFDSWAGELSPADYDTFAAPYQRKVVELVKQTHPDTPMILYISGSAGYWSGWAAPVLTSSRSIGPSTWPMAVLACPTTSACRAMWTLACCSAPPKPSAPASMTRCAKPAVGATSSTWATASCPAHLRKMEPPSLKLAKL